MGLDFRLGRLDSRDFKVCLLRFLVAPMTIFELPQAQRKRIYTLCAAVRSGAVYTPNIVLGSVVKIVNVLSPSNFNPRLSICIYFTCPSQQRPVGWVSS